MKEEICTLPGNESGAEEWCRVYCTIYGTGRCRYVPELHKCVVMLEDEG